MPDTWLSPGAPQIWGKSLLNLPMLPGTLCSEETGTQTRGA